LRRKGGRRGIHTINAGTEECRWAERFAGFVDEDFGTRNGGGRRGRNGGVGLVWRAGRQKAGDGSRWEILRVSGMLGGEGEGREIFGIWVRGGDQFRTGIMRRKMRRIFGGGRGRKTGGRYGTAGMRADGEVYENIIRWRNL